MTLWRHQPTHELTGRSGFRLLPDDELQARPATGRVESAAAGNALLVRYEWEHPDDGQQAGILLIGSPDDEHGVHATWLDSWHQQPGPMLLTGVAPDGVSCALAGTYADGWGWQIRLSLADGLELTMYNVVPSSADPSDRFSATAGGAYAVMVLTLAPVRLDPSPHGRRSPTSGLTGLVQKPSRPSRPGRGVVTVILSAERDPPLGHDPPWGNPHGCRPPSPGAVGGILRRARRRSLRVGRAPRPTAT